MLPPMRRANRQITDPAQLEDILRRGRVLRLAMCHGDQPYLLPLNYGYAQGRVYLHTGRQGLKLEYLRANPRVCFEVSVDVELVPAQEACAWNCHYQCVLGFGRAVEVTDEAERRLGLLAITSQYAGPGPHALKEESLARACLLRIDIEEMSGKQNPPPGPQDGRG
ncbi:MAG: pyridoxamine 5'-phosphate oxidase family protein [Desulfarculus sp.]|nr:pyridoxamine 5'-phosphate oxidase family protein [Desulfarculus sp.]